MTRRLRKWSLRQGAGRSVRREAQLPGAGPRGRLSQEPGALGTSVGAGGAAFSPSPLHSRNHVLLSFQVSRKYSDIEEFYQKLSSRYPAASLPPLPRKVLFVGECDIRERRAMFDEIDLPVCP